MKSHVIVLSLLLITTATEINRSDQSTQNPVKLTDDQDSNESEEIIRTEMAQLKSEIVGELLLKFSEEFKEIKNVLKQLTDANLLSTETFKTEIELLKECLGNCENATKARHDKKKKKIEIQKKWSELKQQVDQIEKNYSVSVGDELNEMINSQKDFTQMPPDVILWNVNEDKLQKLLEEKTSTIHSDEIFNISNGMKIKPWLSTYFTRFEYAQVLLELCEDESVKRNASQPFLHSRKFILLDQSNSSSRDNSQVIKRPYFGMSYDERLMHLKAFRVQFGIKPLKGESKYLKNHRLLILIVLEPLPFTYKRVASNNGVLLWKIQNYSKLKKNEIEGLQRCTKSPPFKSSKDGYLFDVDFCFEGDMREKEVLVRPTTVYVNPLHGENDALLPDSFWSKITVHLLDQSDSPEKDDIVLDFENEFNHKFALEPFFIVRNFTDQTVLENAKYLKDDSIFIKVVLEIK